MASDLPRAPAIRIEGLRVTRSGTMVLPDLTCEVASASVTGLLGPSGSGKSTLIRTIVGVQRVSGGRVDVLGHPAGALPLRNRVGYMTQSPAIYGDLTIEENLEFFAGVLDLARDRIRWVLDAVALEALRDRVVKTLSGGERARVSLAAALLGEPDLLVLDEPTVGLDPVLRRDLWKLFHRLGRRLDASRLESRDGRGRQMRRAPAASGRPIDRNGDARRASGQDR